MTSLYIHIPFCRSKCLFCSFTVAVGKENAIDSYLEALDKEASLYAGSAIETVYIGGGTPTFMNIIQLKRLFEIIRRNFKCDNGSEWTIEANPEDVHSEKAKFLLGEGINRVSIGVQSLKDKYLKFLGRSHDRNAALEAFRCLRRTGFSNINLDLMFSFPGQHMSEIEEDVREIAALGSEHLSLYTLTIEEGSRFFRLPITLDDDIHRAEQYVRVVEILEEEGLHQYEVSNFAKEGFASRHNCCYWEGGNYIGLGVGAHAHLDGKRFWNTNHFDAYIAEIKNGKNPTAGSEKLNVRERFIETLLFGLRMNKGVNIKDLEKRFSCSLPAETEGLLEQFAVAGFLTRQDDCFKTTLKGRLVLDEISSRII